MENRRVPLRHLRMGDPGAIVPVGDVVEAKPTSANSVSSASREELVVALDSALGACVGMFVAVLSGDRRVLDTCYETLVTSVEAFRENVPKA